MAEYRVPELDLATRMELVSEMVRPATARGWGWVTEQARAYGVSRQFLYDLRDQAKAALTAALQAKAPGPAPLRKDVHLDRESLQRSIAVLASMPSSVRGIQTGLELLFGVQRSVGFISETLQQAGEAAREQNQTLVASSPVLAEADEIFQGGQPCLTVVDGRSFLVLNLEAAEKRDADHWGVTFLNLAERGIEFQDVVSDGAKGIGAGLKAAELDVPLRPDLFHLLRDSHVISQRLERSAYETMTTADRARRAAQEAAAPTRRRGKPLRVTISLVEAETQEQSAIETYDLWQWLLAEARQSLEPITAQGRLAVVQQTQETVQTAISLMLDLGNKHISAFAHSLQDHLPHLLAPLEWLEAQLAPWRTQLTPEDEAFLLWTWCQHKSLDLNIAQDIPACLQPAAQALHTALASFHRTSSLAESLHSWLRPHLHSHRGMPQWLLPLLQLVWNHHSFQRGKRAGQTPLQLAGLSDALSLAEAFDRLFATNTDSNALPFSLAC
jgi:hypothetical protein